MIRSPLTVLLAVLALSSVMMVGCSQKRKVTPNNTRWNMTPELFSTAETHGQIKNRQSRAVDHTTRQAWDDLNMLLLLDEPIRMTEYPIP